MLNDAHGYSKVYNMPFAASLNIVGIKKNLPSFEYEAFTVNFAL